MPTRLTDEIITAAIRGFEEQKRQIDAQIAELRATLSGGGASAGTAPGAPAHKRTVSAAARRRMAAGQQARWARIRGESGSKPAAPAKPKQHRLSAEGRANIVAALKKRWAAKKASAKAKPAAKKKAARKAAAKSEAASAAAAE